MRSIVRTLVAMSISAAVLAAQPMSPPDLVIHGARVHTVNEREPLAEAVAIAGGRFVAVGANASVLALATPATRRIDAQGATIVPGFQDAHGHVLGLGESLERLDLRETRSLEELVARVRQEAASTPSGEWILGRGWDQNEWPGGAWPTAAALDAAAPDHPVALTRVDGHALVANSRALTAGGITAATADPPGGRIVRDTSGVPSGVLVDAAQALVLHHVPAPATDHLARRIEAADRRLSSLGITAVHDAGVSPETIAIYQRLAREGRLRTRLYVMLSGGATGDWFARGPLVDPTHRLTVRAVKLVADGALGSRGAALLQDYADDPGNGGLLLLDAERLYLRTREAAAAGFQVATHAIGDRANRLVLDVYERVRRDVPGSGALRFRIEHAQVLTPADIQRFSALGVIASMQAVHGPSDLPWAGARLGPERVRGAYAWRSVLDGGAVLANGSDFPVEPADPLLGFYASITRQDARGQPPGGWSPEQRLTREEALRSFTLSAAYAAHAERELGSIEVGKMADLVMLSADIMSIAPAAILETTVLQTILAGETVDDARRP
jgi:predicted amidohydrolase YtcJ